MALLLAFFLLSIGFSFLCSILEAVLLSITPNYITQLRSQGSKLSDELDKLKNDIDKPLSAILTLNTIAHTVGAIGVGAQAGALFGDSSWDLGFLEISAESIIATLMTLAILILSEIIPKTIGANMWKQLAPFTVKTLKILLFALRPFVWISQLITKSLKKEKEKSVLSRTDFAALTEEGLKSGAIDKSESRIIGNLLQLQQLVAKDIMTPRSVVFSAQKDEKVEDFFEAHKPFTFSRVPIYDQEPGDFVGVILKDQLLESIAAREQAKTLEDFKIAPLFVTDEQPLTEVLDLLMREKGHMALVRDEYGIVGLVTMEDIFETLLGLEIVDETDKVQDMQKLARDLWQKRFDNIKRK